MSTKRRTTGEKKSTASKSDANIGDDVAGSIDNEDSKYKSLMKDENKRIAEEKKKTDAEKKRLKQMPGRAIPQVLSKDESDDAMFIERTRLGGLLSKNNRYKPDPKFDISVYLGGDDGLKRTAVTTELATPTTKLSKAQPPQSSSSSKPIGGTIDFDF